VDRQKREVQRVNLAAIEHQKLKAEIASRRKVLEDLVARQSQTETSEQLRETATSNVRVVDPAEVPKEPSSPRTKLNLLLATLLGLVTGVGFAFLLDHLDNTVRNEQDIERHAPGLALLGYVPLYEPLRAVDPRREEGGDGANPVALASHLEPRSGVAESFRNLRTSLLLAAAERPPRRILVTSCEPNDGKSTVALNLAIVLAQMGRRVALVDGDLRRPRVHRVLGLENGAGLTTYLTGNAEFDELLRESAIANLWAVPSGPIPPNPAELLDSARLDLFLSRLEVEAGFDHVLFDSPPVLQVADAVILSSRMEATVLVVRAGVTSRTALLQGVARLRQARARLAGAVLNAVSEKAGYYYYRYYRYSRYYREGEEKIEAGGGGESKSSRPARTLRA
jgi:capsular exopolysaccharide synthesis family protein